MRSMVQRTDYPVRGIGAACAGASTAERLSPKRRHVVFSANQSVFSKFIKSSLVFI